jgi:uncharacterized protein (DUF1778 family)
MPRIAVEDNSRLSLRIRPEAARAVIEEADHVRLSGRDSLRVLDLLENPPAPNAKMRAAARALAKHSKL